MFNCIIFYTSEKCLQFSSFPNKFEFLVKSKMGAILVAILVAILNGIMDPPPPPPGRAITQNIYLNFVDHMTGYLLEVKYLPNIVTPQKPSLSLHVHSRVKI